MTSKIIFVLTFLSVSALHISIFNITINKIVINKPKSKEDKVYISLVEEEAIKNIEKKIKKEKTEKKQKKNKKKKSKEKKKQVRRVEALPHPKVSIKKKVDKQIHDSEPIRRVEVLPHPKVSIKKKVDKQIYHGEPVRRVEALPHRKVSLQDNIQKIKNIEKEYLAYIESVVRKKIKYPRRARRKKKEGTVLISINIDRFGSIKNIKIIKKSKSKILDKSAYKIFKSINKFKAIPKELKKDSWNIKVPVVYKLRQNG